MKIIRFLLKHYWVFLAIVVVVSYGQLLLMFPWQDDHALMFKLANIAGKAGYLGPGIFGDGAYKYTAAFYYPVYLLFGFNVPIYFLESLIFYFLAAFAVYKVFSEVLNEKVGRLAGFLFAAGYIAADGFIRLYNSVGTSLSVILISCMLYSYWEFYRKLKARWYFLALLFYFLAVELIRYRTHYLIAVVVAFELLFLAFRKPVLKSALNSLIRLVPFGYIFYRYFIIGGDSRSGRVGELVTGILRGEFYKFYSLAASLANLVLPDWLSQKLIARIPNFVLSWFATGVFSVPVLNLTPQDTAIPFLGIALVILGIFVFFKIKENQKIYLLLLLWIIFNILSYAAYEPNVAHETTGRFLAHSFFALTGLLAILAMKKKWVYLLVIFWGIGNLVNSYQLERKIVNERSGPAKSFYGELRNAVPKLNKGDVLYFDVADEARQAFADSFSVAQMPEETAIAWQYGIDRYDIRRVTEFNALTSLMKAGVITDINSQPVKIGHVYSFFYSKDGLVNTTAQLQLGLGGRQKIKEVQWTTKKNGDEVLIDLTNPITSVTPVNLTLEIQATAPNLGEINFPYITNQSLAKNEIASNGSLATLAFDYQRQKNAFVKNTRSSASSFWKDNVAANLADGQKDTFWRADRVLWSKEGAFFTLDLGKMTTFDRFVWLNGYAADSPTEYEIEVSGDGQSWRSVARVSANLRIEPETYQVVTFDPISARFVKMRILNTLDHDSASIAEAWVVSAIFSRLDIKQAEEFLSTPLGFVPDAQRFLSTLSAMDYTGLVQISWLGDKSESWQTGETAILNLKYDGVLRTYNLQLPPGGTKINQLKLSQKQIPGIIEIRGIEQ